MSADTTANDVARARVERLGRRIVAVRDPALHRSVLERWLAETDPEVLVEDFACLLRVANQARATEVYTAVAHHLLPGETPPYAVREALYRVARERGADMVASLFLDPSPRRHVGSWRGDPDPDLLDRTLGERKSMARRPNRSMLQRLMRMPEPDVARILLENPHLGEPDVVWLAARRPNLPIILLEVARSRRWWNSSRVRLALALNPYGAPRVGVLLCPLLALTELRQVADDPNVHPLVTDMARHVLLERQPAIEEVEAARVIPFPVPTGEE